MPKLIFHLCIMIATLSFIQTTAAGPAALPKDGEVKIDTDINSADVEIVIMSTEQYHFLPLGSFFQFSTSSWEFGPDSSFLNKGNGTNIQSHSASR